MLDERIRTTLSLLIATQHDGAWLDRRQPRHGRHQCPGTIGRWCWPTRPGSTCRREVLDSSLGGSAAAPAATRKATWKTKAIVLHALAIGGQGDFALANHLLRDRKLLSPLGRAYLALALLQMDRKEIGRPTSFEAASLRHPAGSKHPAPRCSGRNPRTRKLSRPHGQLDGPGLAEHRPGVAAGQGADRNDSEPTHGPPLDPGKSDRAGRPGRDHVAGEGSSGRRAVPLGDRRQRQAGQDARSRSARADANGRRAFEPARQGTAADRVAPQRSRAAGLSLHAGGCRSGGIRARELGRMEHPAKL